MKLHTRRFLNRQEFDLGRTGLKVGKRSLLDSIDYEIPLEHIHNRKKVQTNTNDNFLVISFSLLVIGLLFLFGSNTEISIVSISAGTFFLALALVTRRKIVSIATYDGDKIEIFFNNRNKQEVLDFSERIIDASNSFLLKKYGKIDKDLPVDGQLSNLDFLRDRGIITDDEFEELKNQLLGRGNKGALGFNRS